MDLDEQIGYRGNLKQPNPAVDSPDRAALDLQTVRLNRIGWRY